MGSVSPSQRLDSPGVPAPCQSVPLHGVDTQELAAKHSRWIAALTLPPSPA
ncbi:hypothetical protein [Candidatus Methylacidithermus pantelleriae]|uniref:hypothetical protein n=1 Tax=Candidatus Methylacidithermus pantelleriae TaxID=2744239 RepID=UPI00157C21A7|nr:hypothetical protein [Candidatus Methylacidithermus pantelleriae]